MGLELAPGALVAVDYDGTVAPIVDDPEQAVPLPGTVEQLERLAGEGIEVAVISGRPVSFLGRFLPDGLTVVGIYGLEVRRDGHLEQHPSAGVWRETITDVASSCRRRAPEGTRVELKDSSLTLHYREHPEIAEAVLECAEDVGRLAGLQVRPARMSVELHPPIAEDKGTALRRLASESTGPVVFIGDDVGDLAAFSALDDLAAAGRAVTRVAVRSDESPPELLERADLIVEGPVGVRDLLAGATVS